MLVVPPVQSVSAAIHRRSEPYHDRMPQCCRSLVLLIHKLRHKLAADRPVLPKLLLEPFRVPLQMLHQPVIGRHEHRCHIDQQLSQLHPAAALVRRAHKYNPVCRRLDRPMFLQRSFPRRVRVNESLARLAANTTGRSEADTFNNYTTQAVCHEDYRPFRCLPESEPPFDFRRCSILHL
jgi:hypothetical protein